MEIKRIENSQCNDIKGFVVLRIKKRSETSVTFSKPELWNLLPVSEVTPELDSFTSTRTVSRRSQCFISLPWAILHPRHRRGSDTHPTLELSPQESRRQPLLHIGANAETLPFGWSSRATCRFKKKCSEIKLRENRKVLCTRGKIVPPASACLSVCLSILGKERKFLYFFTATDIQRQGLFFLKHHLYKLELFWTN